MQEVAAVIAPIIDLFPLKVSKNLALQASHRESGACKILI